jgi:hypothetical protein
MYQPSDVYHIVKIQAYIRAFNETSTVKNKAMKRKVIDEVCILFSLLLNANTKIVQSEYVYCKNLQILQSEFKVPLYYLANQNTSFNEKELDVLFSNIDDILTANSSLYIQICPLMGSHDSRVIVGIFQNEIPNLEQTYECLNLLATVINLVDIKSISKIITNLSRSLKF